MKLTGGADSIGEEEAGLCLCGTGRLPDRVWYVGMGESHIGIAI